MAAPMPVKEGLRLLRLVRESGRDNRTVLMHCDSQGAMVKIHDPMSSNPTKHIDVEHQFVPSSVLVRGKHGHSSYSGRHGDRLVH